MICPYCQEKPPQQSVHYNIENVKQRFIPTFYHTQIFAPLDSQIHKVRCTATFHSKSLQVDGYGINPQQKVNRSGINQEYPHNLSKQKKNVGQKDSVIYRNGSRERKQNEFYSARGTNYNNRNQLWYDSAKKDLFSCLDSNAIDYSKERKMIDLSSNPVFGGVVMEERPDRNNQPSSSQNQEEIQRPMKQITNGQIDQIDQTNLIQDQLCHNQKQTIEAGIQTEPEKYIQTKKKNIKPKKNSKIKFTVNQCQGVSTQPTFTIVRKKPF